MKANVFIVTRRLFYCILMSQNELHFHDVIKLFRDDLQSEGPDGTQLVTLGMLPALCISLVNNISSIILLA